ncbi:hypothetical protein GPECTOR_86g384 [Gonium pectorale]|uniref:Uncharacterized protein n=1 Tax=Gonium pectorale TaxID=33097 RepID=A0A150G1A2_GONPE|nr:hypothetical protein GPECTOR_86g384 [Gonium pectorale]|eukprot:KXZ43591.1 hypothetical protein GPECTOR_86g384 [Gonium pectorale]
MEHSGLPPDAVLDGVLAQTAKVVDHCLGPDDSGHLLPVSDVADPPLVPGDWCYNAPLWGNPLLLDAGAVGRRPGLEALHGPLSDCRRLLTIGDAVRVAAALSAFEEERRQALAAEVGFGIFAVLAGR